MSTRGKQRKKTAPQKESKQDTEKVWYKEPRVLIAVAALIVAGVALLFTSRLLSPLTEKSELNRLINGIGEEVSRNLDQVLLKLEVLERGPAVGLESKDESEKLISRVKRALGFKFESDFYRNNQAGLIRLESREHLETFYRILKITAKAECATLWTLAKEQPLASLGVIAAHPIDHTGYLQRF